ncbi:MAG: PTS transporter subunit EIIC [Coprobacillus sp.]
MSFNNKFMSKMMPIADWIAQNRYLLSIRDGFMLAFPATMFASIAIILQNLPATFGFAEYIPEGINIFLNDFFGPIGNATMNISTLFIVFGIAYNLAKHYEQSALYAGGVALSSFLLLVPFGSGDKGAFIGLQNLGAQGMFVGMVVAFLSTEIFCALEKANITIKMPSSVPTGIARSFTAIIPAAASLLVFNAIRYGFTFTAYGNVIDFVYNVLQAPIVSLGATLPATILVIIFTQIFWWFGIHGTLVVNSVVDPIHAALSLENYNAYLAGIDRPNIICTTFMGCFATTGIILGIALASILFIAKSKRLKSTMQLVATPAVFNISEPITFGLPIVLNPVILIPWILAPVAMVTTSYFAMYFGLVPKPIGATVVWSTPMLLSGWLATGSITGALLQLFNVALTTVIWFPFLKALDKGYLKDEEQEEQDDIVHQTVNNQI